MQAIVWKRVFPFQLAPSASGLSSWWWAGGQMLFWR